LPPFSQTWVAPMEYDDSGATRSLNVAAVCLNVDISPDVNRNKILAFIDRIKAERPDVRLILFGETTLGYAYRPSNPSGYQKSIAETVPGATTDLISQKAIEYQIYISFGMVEKSGEDLYNSQVLIGPDGTILSVHHKYYLTPTDKENGVKAGNSLTLNVIDNIKVATIICYDVQNLELNRKIHDSGAELVLYPVANSNELPANIFPPYYHFTYSWMLSADRVGNEDGTGYDGRLFLSAPSGEHRIMQTGKETYIYGVVKCR